MRTWVGVWLAIASAVLVVGNGLNLSPTVQFYTAVVFAAIGGMVCLVLVVEKQ